MKRLICQDCKHTFNSEKDGQWCPKCKDGYAITIMEYNALKKVQAILGKMLASK